MTLRYFLRPDAVRALVDAHHLTHTQVAARLGLSRAYWSQLLHARRALTPNTRRRLLDCDVFAGVLDADLWERLEVPMREAS